MSSIFNIGRMAAITAAGIFAVAVAGSASAQQTVRVGVDFEDDTDLPTALNNDGPKDEPVKSVDGTDVTVTFSKGMRLDSPAVSGAGDLTNVYGAGKSGKCPGCMGGIMIEFSAAVSNPSFDVTNGSGGGKYYRAWLNGARGNTTPAIREFIAAGETRTIDMPLADHGTIMEITIAPEGLSDFYIDNVMFDGVLAGQTLSVRAFIPGDHAPTAPNVFCVALPEMTVDGTTKAPKVFRGTSASVDKPERRGIVIAGAGSRMPDSYRIPVSQSVTVSPGMTTDDLADAEDTIENNVAGLIAFSDETVKTNGEITVWGDYSSGVGGDCDMYHKTFPLSDENMKVEVTPGMGSVSVRFSGSVDTPLDGKPAKDKSDKGKPAKGAITWDLVVTLNTDGRDDTKDTYTVSGTHTGFPAFEVLIGSEAVYSTEADIGAGPYSFKTDVKRPLRSVVDVGQVEGEL